MTNSFIIRIDRNSEEYKGFSEWAALKRIIVNLININSENKTRHYHRNLRTCEEGYCWNVDVEETALRKTKNIFRQLTASFSCISISESTNQNVTADEFGI